MTHADKNPVKAESVTRFMGYSALAGVLLAVAGDALLAYSKAHEAGEDAYFIVGLLVFYGVPVLHGVLSALIAKHQFVMPKALELCPAFIGMSVLTNVLQLVFFFKETLVENVLITLLAALLILPGSLLTCLPISMATFCLCVIIFRPEG